MDSQIKIWDLKVRIGLYYDNVEKFYFARLIIKDLLTLTMHILKYPYLFRALNDKCLKAIN